MSHKNCFRTVSLLVVFALLLGAWRPVLAQETPDEPAPQGIRFDAPPYAVDGPYGVGVRYFTIPAAAENDRELTATVWYPAEPPEGDISEIVYELQFPTGQFPPFSVLGHAQLDAPPDASGAPYPLVVYSHAHWSMGQEVPYFVEHLASRGFVVISVDHEDNWSTDMGPMAYQTMIRRPQEVTRQIDFAEQLSTPDGEMAGLIATDKVGVGGWSMGGITSMALAGARMDLAGLRAWCEANPTLVEENSFACVDMLDHEAEMAEFAGLDAIPTGLWPSAQDNRIAAAVRLSGSLFMYGSEGMAAVDVPVMLFHGGGEALADPSLQVGDPYASVAAPRKAEVVLDHAGHLVFNSNCEDNPDMAAMGFPMFCTDLVWDMDRAHDLINHFATAFLLAELKGDTEAADALAPENVAFPGIQFETTGYDVAPEAALDEAIVAKIGALVEQTMADKQVPGAALGIVKDGELVYAKGFGVAELGNGAPVTPESVFYMASIGKSVTGMAIMQLAEEGKIDLDAPVIDYLPYFTLNDPAAESITVRQLLAHSSGMADYGDWMADLADPNQRTDDVALEEYVRTFSNGELLFPPGEGWSYSNSGFDTLGDVVAKVSGQSYEEYVQDHILSPLAMGASTFLLGEVDSAALVAPHTYDADGAVAAQDFFPFVRKHGPSGNLFSSVKDMARFASANMNHGELDGVRALPETAYDDMWSPQAASTWVEAFGPQVTDYGLGWWVGDFNGHTIIGNYGAEAGFQTHLGIFPEEGFAVIAMANAYHPEAGAFPAYDIGNAVAAELLGTAPEEDVVDAEPLSTLDPAMADQIDAMVEETMARINLPGFALAVVKDGELAYAKGFGVTSLDGGAPVTAQTVFQWNETAMSITAMAVMQLVEEGKLDLSAPVTDYVPYFKLADERYKEITVGQVLAHTSGIPDSGDAMADWENFMPEYDGGALERWVRNDLAEKGLLFAPGTGWEYSDLAYALLGAVIGAASGQPYEEYMAEHIFAPLGMEKSTFLLEEVDKTLLANPHVPNAAGEVVVTEAMPYHRPFAATNNLFASVEDMAKLTQANLNQGALGDQRILPEKAYATMWSATSPTPFADFSFGRVHPSMLMIDWGAGWFLGDVGGHLTPNGGGGEHGFLAQMFLIPDANLGVVAVGNSQAMDEYYAADIAADVLGMLLEE